MTAPALVRQDCQELGHSYRLKLEKRTKTEHGEPGDTGVRSRRTRHVTGRRYCQWHARRITVKGVRREEIDTEQLSLIFWLQAKRILRERREQEQKAKVKAKRREQGK